MIDDHLYHSLDSAIFKLTPFFHCADNYTELIVPARALTPTTAPEQRGKQFDDILGMLANMRELFSAIQRG